MTGKTGPIVWIVDDVQSVRESIAALLYSADILVRGCGSAAEFLREFNPDEFGCIFLDHNMPGMNGMELLTALRQRGITHPVIVMTGQGDKMLEEKVLGASAATMLHKPVDGVELITLIQKILNKKP